MKIDKFKEFVTIKYPNIDILNNNDIKYRDRVNFICKKHGSYSSRLDHFIEVVLSVIKKIDWMSKNINLSKMQKINTKINIIMIKLTT
jgi:hypothetical protein